MTCAFMRRGAIVGAVYRDRFACHYFAAVSAVRLHPGSVCVRPSRCGGGAIGFVAIAMQLFASMSTKRVFLFSQVLGKEIFADRSVCKSERSRGRNGACAFLMSARFVMMMGCSACCRNIYWRTSAAFVNEICRSLQQCFLVKFACCAENLRGQTLLSAIGSCRIYGTPLCCKVAAAK